MLAVLDDRRPLEGGSAPDVPQSTRLGPSRLLGEAILACQEQLCKPAGSSEIDWEGD